MLSDKDRLQIVQELFDKFKSEHATLGMTEKEKAAFLKNQQREQRKAYLEELKNLRQESLAQAIESVKLSFEDSKVGKALIGVNKVISPFAKAGSDITKTITRSNFSNNFYQSLMYSNPLTALLADNMDILKGVGSAGLSLGKNLGKVAGMGASSLYSLLRKRKSNLSTEGILSAKNNLLTDNLTYRLKGDQTYKLTNNTFMLPDKQKLESDVIDLPKNMYEIRSKEDENNTKLLSRGVDGISKSMENINKTVKDLKAKQVITAGIILLGIAAIVAAIKGVKINPFNNVKRDQNTDAHTQAAAGQNAGNIASSMLLKDPLKHLKSQIEKNPQNIGKAGTSTTTNYKKGDKIANKIDTDHGYDPTTFTKTSFKGTEKPFLVTCPLDRAKVTHIKTITKDKAIFYEVTIEQHGLTAHSGKMIFHYLTQSYVYKGQVIPKYYPIGMSSKYFYISSNGTQNKSLAKDFEKFTNQQAENNYNDSRYVMGELSAEEQEKIRKYNYDKIGAQYTNNLFGEIGPGEGKTGPLNSNNNQYPSNYSSVNKNVSKAIHNVKTNTSPVNNPKTVSPQVDPLPGNKLVAPAINSSNIVKNFGKGVGGTLANSTAGGNIKVGR